MTQLCSCFDVILANLRKLQSKVWVYMPTLAGSYHGIIPSPFLFLAIKLQLDAVCVNNQLSLAVSAVTLVCICNIFYSAVKFPWACGNQAQI